MFPKIALNVGQYRVKTMNLCNEYKQIYCEILPQGRQMFKLQWISGLWNCDKDPGMF